MDPIRSIPNTPFYVDIIGKNWDDCRSAAETWGFTFASIKNQQENDAVVDYLWSNDMWNAWLGGYQTSYEVEPAGNWAWLEGTKWTDSTYTNWYVDDVDDYYHLDWSQPDNWNNNEHHLYLLSFYGAWGDIKKNWELPCLFRDPT